MKKKNKNWMDNIELDDEVVVGAAGGALLGGSTGGAGGALLGAALGALLGDEQNKNKNLR